MGNYGSLMVDKSSDFRIRLYRVCCEVDELNCVRVVANVKTFEKYLACKTVQKTAKVTELMTNARESM